MTIIEFISAILLMFFVTICLHTLIDRVCQCCEKCAFLKNSVEYSKNCDEKTEEKAENLE